MSPSSLSPLSSKSKSVTPNHINNLKDILSDLTNQEVQPIPNVPAFEYGKPDNDICTQEPKPSTQSTAGTSPAGTNQPDYKGNYKENYKEKKPFLGGVTYTIGRVGGNVGRVVGDIGAAIDKTINPPMGIFFEDINFDD